ncbi:MAG: hypothetical protein AB8B55_05005 [Mariniblastus sp.]
MNNSLDQSQLLLAVGGFIEPFNDGSVTSWKFILYSVVGGITCAISQTAPRTCWCIVVSFINNFAIGVVAGSALLALLTVAWL